MTFIRWTAALAVVALVACVASAERPPEQKKDAQMVVMGELTNITEKEDKIGAKKDGVLMHYEADLKVTAVEKGDGVKVGDMLKINWIYATKKPTGAFVGAFGHDYGVKKGDQVRVYLMKRQGGMMEVIYSPEGMMKK